MFVNNSTSGRVGLRINNNQNTNALQINQSGSATASIINHSGAGIAHDVSLTNSQGFGYRVQMNRTTDTYLYNSSPYGFWSDVISNVDAPSILGGRFRGVNGRTTKGTNADEAYGIDAYAFNGITSPVGNYGAAGRFTSQTSNVNVLRLNGHSSQLVPIISGFRGTTEVFRFDSIGRLTVGGGQAFRTLTIIGEARITDLSTDTPTSIVGSDGDGDLGTISIGNGLALLSSTLAVSAYQTDTIPLSGSWVNITDLTAYKQLERVTLSGVINGETIPASGGTIDITSALPTAYRLTLGGFSAVASDNGVLKPVFIQMVTGTISVASGTGAAIDLSDDPADALIIQNTYYKN